MAERKATSCYILSIELDAPGGGDRRETFTYAKSAHVMSALEQEVEGRLLGGIDDALEAICTRAQAMTLAAVQRGVLVRAIDVRRFLSARDAEGQSHRVDELEAEWDPDDHVARRVGSDAKLVALELDRLGLLEAVPALEEPWIAHGESVAVAAQRGEKDATALALVKQLKKGVTYGYADATGDYVSRERYEDPDPPSIDDLDAWLAQRPSSAVALEIAKSIAARGDRELARRWVEKARREGLPTAKIEAVVRDAFTPSAAAPAMRVPVRRVEIALEVLERDARWEPVAQIVRGLTLESGPAIEERLRVLSRETDDADLAVVALMLRRHIGRARGAAHSALMLKQAMQRSSETILPGVALGEELDDADARAHEALLECARRLEACRGALSPADELLLALLPTSFDARRIERAAQRLARSGGQGSAASGAAASGTAAYSGAAYILAIADRLVSDPADVCELAAERARLSLRAGASEEALAITTSALAYWDAHGWMRGAAPPDLRFWHAAACAARGDRAELDAITSRSEPYRALAERELVTYAPVVEAAASEPEVEDDGSLRAGMRVGHAKFGAGAVERVEGRGESAKITVSFDSGETKVLLGRFLTRA